jgi:hypothetical protein
VVVAAPVVVAAVAAAAVAADMDILDESRGETA